MVMIHPLYSDSLDCNAFVVFDDKTCVIDPGINALRIISFLRDEGFKLDYVVNTHCHFDHTGADKAVLDETGAKLAAHEIDALPLEDADSSLILSDLFGKPFERVYVDVKLEDGFIIDLGGTKLQVLHTPGHTQGSICLFDEETGDLFSGDTVFAEGVGRTDFPGGSLDALSESIEKLSQLASEGDIKSVYPGHGPASDAGAIARAKKLFA